MIRQNSVILLIFSILLISFTSAGLQITPNSINITKIADEDTYFSLSIKNTETFEMKNIAFLDTIQANQFNLLSGENKTFQFKITSNDGLIKTVRLGGYFLSNLGQSNRTELVNVAYPSGADRCNLNIIMGDSVSWKNNVGAGIKIKNIDTNQEITSLASGETKTIKFTQAQSVNYKVYLLSGVAYTDSCNINVMSTSGLIRNTDLDGLLNLNLTVNYPATNLTPFFLTTSYNLSYNEAYSDVFSLRNTGDKTAKHVKLSANWVTFDKNDFDILPGQSVNIGYVVKPLIYETGQTNQNYISVVKVDGNFPQIVQNISLFVKYANIGAGIGNISALSPEVLQFLIQTICEKHPEFPECKVSASCGNATIKEVSAIFNEDTIFEMLQQDAIREGQDDTFRNQQNELMANITSSTSNQNEKLQNVLDRLDAVEKETGNSNASTIFLGIMFLAIGIIVTFIFLIIKNKGKFKMFADGKFQKGERPL